MIIKVRSHTLIDPLIGSIFHSVWDYTYHYLSFHFFLDLILLVFLLPLQSLPLQFLFFPFPSKTILFQLFFCLSGYKIRPSFATPKTTADSIHFA